MQGDCNYPSDSTGKRCVRTDGIGATALLDAVLDLLSLDTGEYTAPVTLMAPAEPGAKEPDIWAVKTIVLSHDPKTSFAHTDRFAFYELAKNAYAAVQTSEQAFYGCIILRKALCLPNNSFYGGSIYEITDQSPYH